MSFDSFETVKVKAVDQSKFEEDILCKADRDYKNHIDKARESINIDLKETTLRIKILKESVESISEKHNNNINIEGEHYYRINSSLSSLIGGKKAELEKLKRIEKRLTDQLKSFDLSNKFTDILNEAGRHHKPDCDVDCAVDSDDSGRTEVFESHREELEYCEPLIKKRRVEQDSLAEMKLKLPQSSPSSSSQRRQSIMTMKKKSDQTSVIIKDDADNEVFYERIIEYQNGLIMEQQQHDDDDKDHSDSETGGEVEIGSAFIVPGRVWHKLYQFQQTGVRWLLQLHNNNIGGILGDEMGLGKTVQVIAFLAGLQRSCRDTVNNNYECGPILIVCPATVLRQWLLEFRAWAPLFRVAVLHSTGDGYDRPKRLMTMIANEPGVLLTTYTSMVLHHSLLIQHQWQYIILDEGHKIKNPNTKMTVCVKKFTTLHRLIMSGSPIQNNLKELWSLVDFVCPGKLGSLSSFMQNFAMPIMKGGYENASPLQVETAYRCACVIRDTINSYLIRRSKSEVQLQLPKKSEQVLFCGLTEHQVLVYKEYLRSTQCKQILTGKTVPFPGLVTLRKICNHTDLVTGGPSYVMNHPLLGFGREAGADGLAHKYGHYSRSGKMLVLAELLELWYRGKHKVLLFTQGRMMLEILKRYIEKKQYPYCVMDGRTSVGSRHSIVQQFNSASYSELFVFLLTTRVGGVGLNLTGADRVLIFDPDWNPCTDLQARERSWRIGQERQVTIYRLVTTGTIEEKIYHRQVFKQFLTNRILKNPRQRRFFKTQDLYDLFRLDDKNVSSDTSLMFDGDKNYKQFKKNYFDETPLMKDIIVEDNDIDDNDNNNNNNNNDDDNDKEGEGEGGPSEEEIALLREQARRLSKAISKLQESPCTSSKTTEMTKVEGQSISNVRYRREYKVPQKHTSEVKAAAGGDHLVSVLVPRKLSDEDSLSYQDCRAADRVAERARRSLEERTLARAGVTESVKHDDMLADSTCDWSLELSERERSAKAAVSWLRSQLIIMDRHRDLGNNGNISRPPPLGLVRNANLWNKQHEGTVFLGSLLEPRFSGSTGSANHGRFSSVVLLAIIGNRAPQPSLGTSDYNSIVSSELKNMTKSLFLFFSQRGEVSSEDIIAYFKDSVPPSKNLIFKAVLSLLCSFHKLTTTTTITNNNINIRENNKRNNKNTNKIKNRENNKKTCENNKNKDNDSRGVWRLKPEFINK